MDGIKNEANYTKHNARMAAASELLVRAQLLLFGQYPAFYDLDDGVDVLLTNGTRIQIKSGLPILETNKRRWKFVLKKGHRGRKLDNRSFDFLICVGFFNKQTYLTSEPCSIFIIPAKDIDETLSCISIECVPKSTSRYAKYKDDWQSLLDSLEERKEKRVWSSTPMTTAVQNVIGAF